MKLTPTDLAILATFVLAAIVMALRDDPRALHWLKAQWSKTVGVWFARRRMVGSFTQRRHGKIRVGEPDEHSPGIMVARRDITTGNWT